MVGFYLLFRKRLQKERRFFIMAAMKRWAGACFLLFLLARPAAAVAPPPDAAGHGSPGGGLPRLQRDLAGIICGCLSLYEREHDPRFLEMAMQFGEVRTHPIFELAWGRQRRNAEREVQLLRAAARLLGHFTAGGRPAADSERALCLLAQEYIRANDPQPGPVRRTGLDLPSSCGLAHLQEGLTGSQLLLKYVLLDDRVLVFFVGAGHAGYEFLPFGRSQTAAMVRKLSEPLEAFADGKVDYLRIHFDLELANRLYNLLLKRAVERFPQADELFIIPDGELFMLPFEALVMRFHDHFQLDDALFSEYKAAGYVIQDFKVSYFFSLADFLRSFQGLGEYPLSLAAFGYPLIHPADPQPSSTPPGGAGGFADIPSTRREVLSLDRLFSGSRRRVFLGADFNRENFCRYAPQARLVHLATHFYSDRKDPLRSAFLFSSAGKKASYCDSKQIFDLRLQAELVILSACETSEKDLLGFKLVSGMTAAFRRSGARGLVASLWPIDEFSSELVPLFCREYLGSGDDAAALRRAKLALFGRTIAIRDDVHLSLAHPFLWANYVLYRFSR